MPAPLNGVFAAALTPLTDTLAPDHHALIRHCRWLLQHGCDGLAVHGTTGEANSFSVDERIGMLEALAGAGIPGAALLPGVGCCAITDTVKLSRAALAIGAAGVLMLPPFYYKTVTEEGVFAAFAETIERVGDDRLRVYLYHFPQMSAVPVPLGVIQRLRARYGAIIAGMKDSSGDFANMRACATALDDFAVFSGSDEFLLPLLEAGGAGCITAVCNVASSLAGEVHAAWKRGELAHARSRQERLNAVRAAISSYPLTAALKEIMADQTGVYAWRNLRPPLTRIDSAACAALASALDRLGFAPPVVC